MTLVEPTRTYYTCFFSNLYIGGFKEVADIGHTYGRLASDFGINVVHDWAVGVDRSARTVSLAGGATLSYDRLILSPGIDFVDGFGRGLGHHGAERDAACLQGGIAERVAACPESVPCPRVGSMP